MGEVTEFIVDGTSGLSPGGVEGQCLVCGCCSRGEVGKGYLLGKRSDLAGYLGVGPLVDALRDVFAAGGQEPVVIAVPAEGRAGGYITAVKHQGYGPEITVGGQAASAAEVAVKVTVGGANGEAIISISRDGGLTFAEAANVPEDGQIEVSGTGARLSIQATAENPLIEDEIYTFEVVTALSRFWQSGEGPAVEAQGEPKAGGQLRLLIIKSGGLNSGTYQLSIDGGANYGPVRTLPLDGLINVGDLGITLLLAGGEYQAGTLYAWEALPPAPTTAGIMRALAKPLEDYDVEFVYVVGASDSVDWAAAAALGQELWNKHRPTYFKFEARLPREGEDLSDWAADLIRERDGLASHYVQVVAAFGYTSDSSGLSKIRNWGGLNAGRTLANPVQRAAGRIRDGALSQAGLPSEWMMELAFNQYQY